MTLALHGKSRNRQWLLVAVALLAIFGGIGAAVSTMWGQSARAASVAPITFTGDGNPSCTELASFLGEGPWNETKFDPVVAGTQDGITISNIEVVDGVMYFDWSSAFFGIDAVIVKQGSSDHNVYVYDPEAFSDTDLRPSGLSGGAGGISHISFCWDPDPTSTVTDLHDADHNSVPIGSSVPFGSTIHDSATVTPSAATGTVVFSFFENGTCTGTAVATSGALAIVGGTVDATGFAQGPLAAGDYSFQATFTPDSEYLLPSTADCEPFRVRDNPQAVITVVKTADAVYDNKCTWDIDKTAIPETLDLFIGESGEVEYTVDVDLVDCDTPVNHRISGTITIYNDSDATGSLPVEDVTDELGGTIVCAETLPYDLAPGASLACTYEILDATGDETTNTATATVDGVDVDSDPPTPISFVASGILIDDEVDVDDTVQGVLGTLDEDGSFTYTRTFTCDEDEGDHDNTATFTTNDTGTQGSDDATVTVNCYEVEVTKTADTSLTRTWTWDIDKVGDQTELTLSVGQTFIVNYEVTVSATSEDSDWAVNGTIAVYNPAPIDATINSVSDVVSPAIGATVECGVTFPYTLAAGATLNCTYSADLPDATDRTNTATATRQNYDYDEDGVATASGTTDISHTVNVSFAEPVVTEVDECIVVVDDKYGTFTAVCAPGPHTLEYSLDIGPYEVCGTYTYVNTATFTTNDTDTTGSDSWTVNVDVPCDGCTLTPGYWKTHSLYGPAAHPDDTWLLLADGPDTIFFLSEMSYYDALWTNPAGNAYWILAHAYIAAKLNFLNGADPTDAQAAFDAATVLFQTYTPDEIGALRGNNAVRKQFIELAGILDDYNNGLIGPGHCDEDSSSQ